MRASRSPLRFGPLPLLAGAAALLLTAGLASAQRLVAPTSGPLSEATRLYARYRATLSHDDLAAADTAVQAGLAVGAVPQICVRPGLRVLTEKDGFPDPGTFEIGLVRKPGRPSSAADALARHVMEGLSTKPQAMMAAE